MGWDVHRLGLEIHLVRWARLGPKRMGLTVGPSGQQLVTKLPIIIPKYKSTWNVTAPCGNNTSRAKNIREPATRTRLTVT